MINPSSDDSLVYNSEKDNSSSDGVSPSSSKVPASTRPVRGRRRLSVGTVRNRRSTAQPTSDKEADAPNLNPPGNGTTGTDERTSAEPTQLQPSRQPKVGHPRKPRPPANKPQLLNPNPTAVISQTLGQEEPDSTQPTFTETNPVNLPVASETPLTESGTPSSHQGTTKKRERLTKGPDETTKIPFMHPSEREFAQILDYYNIEYLYEPRSFPLRWDGARVVEMFSPDFYLPVQDQYFELTTMKQSLVTQKNRKLRHLHEMYPEINCQLLYRRDIMRLLAKYGYGPLADAGINGVERTLFTPNQIAERVNAIGAQITADFAEQEVVLVGVLKGVICFMADLMRTIDLPLRLDFIEIAQYGEGSGANVAVSKDIPDSIEGRHVILVEDIVDTGMTLQFLLGHLWDKQPASVSVCTLLNKPIRRMNHITIDYCGFDIPDEFVVGYGLDYGGKFRNLPSIGVLRPVEAKPDIEVEAHQTVD